MMLLSNASMKTLMYMYKYVGDEMQIAAIFSGQ